MESEDTKNPPINDSNQNNTSTIFDKFDFEFDVVRPTTLTSAILLIDKRKETIARVEEVGSRISKINHKILDLLYSRHLMLADVDNMINEISSTQYFLGSDSSTISNEWYKSGFNSEVIKNAVAAARTLLFDDRDEKFREYYCVKVEAVGYGYSRMASDLKLVFSNGKNTFDIRFPSRHDYDLWRSDRHQFSENQFAGEISVGVEITSRWHDIVGCSLKIERVRQIIKNLIYNFDSEIEKIKLYRDVTYNRDRSAKQNFDVAAFKNERFDLKDVPLDNMLENGYFI